jgi:signal transduction histidine kinase
MAARRRIRALRSIRWRLVGSFILIVVVAIGVVGVVSVLLFGHFVARRETAYLQSNAAAVAREVRPLLVPVVQPATLDHLVRTSAFMSDSRIRVLDPEHRVLADSESAGGPDQVWIRLAMGRGRDNSILQGATLISVSADPALNAILGRTRRTLDLADAYTMLVRRRSGLWGSLIEFPHEETGAAGTAMFATQAGNRVRHIHVEPVGDPDNPVGYVEIARSPDLPAEALETLLSPFAIAALLAAGLAAILGLAFGRRLTAPIEGLTRSALKMGAGDLGARAPAGEADEIGELSRQFNAMAEKLESTVHDLRQERDILRRFIGDASHELRTPVTALKTFNELLLQGARGRIDAPTRIEFLHDCRRQIERMEWIVANLLNLSRLQAGVTTAQTVRVSLNDLVRAVERRHAREAAAAGVSVAVVSCPAEPELEVDPAGIDIALDNVMRNAIRYSSGNRGDVLISADCAGAEALVQVCDRGPGIAPADLPHIFDRFYRGKRRGNADDGSGLGLAIAQAAVLASGGTISVANNTDGPGTTFTLRLPLSAAWPRPAGTVAAGRPAGAPATPPARNRHRR